MEIGPILPRYIHKDITSLPATSREAVKFLDNPTVPIALKVSYTTSIKLPCSRVSKSSTASTAAITLKTTIASALRTVSLAMLLRKITASSYPFATENAAINNIAAVVVLIPPAVPTGDPPINIRNIHTREVDSFNPFWDIVANPAVLKVTD